MKKMFIIIGSLVLGGIVVTGIDLVIGMSFENVSEITQLIHKTAYMVWGGVIIALASRFG